ncbi:MAG: hypothetical protein ISP69_03915 [Crocinitomicaceae bacterium]|nr:hypothetical protein [Crocinitomicaceae bacterium]
MIRFIFLFLSFAFVLFEVQGQEANVFLSKLVAKLESVDDYSADVLIKADIPLIKILPSKAKIYFKKPDKFKVVSKGIAILPRQGFTDMNLFLSKPEAYMVVLAGEKKIGDRDTKLLTVIANASDSEIILIKLWVDPIEMLIVESEVTTRSSGNVKIAYKYSAQKKYGLPSEIQFTVDVKEFKMPKSFSSNPHKKSTPKTKKRKNGTINLSISNYVVNQGIADSFFVK